MPLTALQWVMVSAGGAVVLLGLWVIAWRKTLWQVLRRVPGRHDPENQGQIAPTRLVLGVVLLFAGYHIAAWALPPDVLSVQLNRSLWWLWAGLGIVTILGSMWIDRLDRP